MKPEHFHDHPEGELVIGCLACIDVVKYDQYKASWREAPVRTCKWRFVGEQGGDWLTFTLDVRVPAGAEPDEVDEYYMEATGPEITIAMTEAGFTDDQCAEAFYCACLTVECVDIGPVVPEPDPAPLFEDLPLF